MQKNYLIKIILTNEIELNNKLNFVFAVRDIEYASSFSTCDIDSFSCLN